MNVIFLTVVRISNIEDKNIFTDLMRMFRDNGHQVYIVTPYERRLGKETCLVEDKGVKILNVKTLNIQKTNIVEKGLGTLLIERQYKAAINKYLKGVKFDLITYYTPPITFLNVVKYLRKRNPKALTYLQLKDIFPQNAVDIGMMTTTGWKGFLYRYFRKKEKALYAVSDYVGCMSPANVQYVLKHNPEMEASRVEVASNSVELKEIILADGQEKAERLYIRNKYDLPTDRPVFIYGGNLGKPQGVDYLIKCLDVVKDRTDCFFVVVGNGTEYAKLKDWYERHVGEKSIKLMPRLERNDYDLMVRYSDVGLIFLDHRFTIPNYPSRLLNYLEYKIPIICATDVNTDIGKIAEENGYGYWCESVKPEDFVALVDKMLASDMKAMGEKGYHFLKENYLVEHTYNAIMKHFVTQIPQKSKKN